MCLYTKALSVVVDVALLEVRLDDDARKGDVVALGVGLREDAVVLGVSLHDWDCSLLCLWSAG